MSIVAVGKAIVVAVKELREWAAHLGSRRRALEEREEKAVRALQSAVIGTSNYVGRLEAGEPPDRRQEENLANLWSDAAIAFYGVNERIPSLLHLKALSWSRPARWIDEQVVAAGITLDEMNDLMVQMLVSGKASA